VELALRGTYPELALQASASVRRRWLGAYVDQLLLRDATLADDRRDPVRLRRYLNALCANTAGVVEHKTLVDAADINRATAVAYDSLFELLFLTERVPAWHTNRLNRLTRTPKRYVTDAAVVGHVLGVDVRAVLRNADLLGRMIETFVLSQLRPEAAFAEVPVALHHLRHDGGRHEVDLIVEAADGRVVAIEVKSTAAPTSRDSAHLAWLRDALGDRFVCGVVFHTGPRRLSLDESIEALPIAAIWGPR
jgi:predicted AAA+ superfamily ATPase